MGTPTRRGKTTYVKERLDLRLPVREILRKLVAGHLLHPRRVEVRVLAVVPRDERGEVDEGAARDRVDRHLLQRQQNGGGGGGDVSTSDAQTRKSGRRTVFFPRYCRTRLG